MYPFYGKNLRAAFKCAGWPIFHRWTFYLRVYICSGRLNISRGFACDESDGLYHDEAVGLNPTKDNF